VAILRPDTGEERSVWVNRQQRPLGCRVPRATDPPDLYPVDQLKDRDTARCRACLNSAATVARQPAECNNAGIKGGWGVLSSPQTPSRLSSTEATVCCLATTSIDHHSGRGAAGAQTSTEPRSNDPFGPAAAQADPPAPAPKASTRRPAPMTLQAVPVQMPCKLCLAGCLETKTGDKRGGCKRTWLSGSPRLRGDMRSRSSLR